MSKQILVQPTTKINHNCSNSFNYKYSLLILLVSILIYILYSTYINSVDAIQLSYIVYIDAGSSGSRIHVHSYSKNSTLPYVISSHSHKLKPGIHKLSDQLIQQQIQQLINYSYNIVPYELYRNTEIYFGGTGGLRSVPIPQQNNILNIVAHTFSTSQFSYHIDNVRLIDGQDEGINGWIATNYLLGNLVSNTEQTTGVIELGGASLQVTYALANYSTPHHQYSDHGIDIKQHYADPYEHNDVVDVHLGPQHYTVYTRSYLNYGLERAQDILLYHMDQHVLIDGHPCYVDGTPDELICNMLNTSTPGKLTGNYSACVNLIQQLFDYTQTDQCIDNIEQCQLELLNIPLIDNNTKFIAIENIYYTSAFFNVQDNHDWLHQLQQRGIQLCSSNWSQLIDEYPDEPVNDLMKYCFSSSYIPYLLQYGLELDLSRTQPIRYINDQPIDWCLGDIIRIIMQQHDSTSYTLNVLLGSVSGSIALYMILRVLLLSSTNGVTSIQSIQINNKQYKN